MPDVRDLLFALVSDLDRDDVMPSREIAQRLAPLTRTAKVGHDDDRRALAREDARSDERLRERRPRVALFGRSLAQRAQQTEEPAATLRPGRDHHAGRSAG